MDKEKKENTKNVENKAEPNVLIRCPRCGGGMRKSVYHNEFEKKPITKIECVKCGKTL